jgi:hypothetical protein
MLKHISIAICLMLPTAATAGFNRNDAVMNSMFAFVAAKNCPHVQLDWPFVAKFLHAYGVETADIKPGGQFYGEGVGYVAVAQADYNKQPAVFCSVASKMFQQGDPKLLIGE